MKVSSLVATSIVIAISIVGDAYADNNAPQFSILNSWTGFYAGVEAGLIFNDVQLRSQQLGFTNPSEHCNASSDFSTFSPGVQFGTMYQFSNHVVTGIEANVTVNTHQTKALNCSCPSNSNVSDRFTFKNQMQTAIKGRVGHTVNWNKNFLLPYLTAGASFANLGLTYDNEGSDYYTQNTTPASWLAGAGIEWALSGNWSLRAEYSYTGYGNIIQLKIPSVYGLIDPNGNAHIDLNVNTILIAINYWI